MKVELDNIRLGVSALTEEVYAGIAEKDNASWKESKNVTNDFYKAVLEKFVGKETIIKSSSGEKYEITVRKI